MFSEEHPGALTPRRQAVLDVLRAKSTALSAADILKLIRRKFPFDKVTLYRTLDFLAQRKLVRRIATAQGYLCYEILCDECVPAHAHFVCVDCGRLECLEDFDLSVIKSGMKSRHRIDPAVIDLKLEGVCQRCQKE